MPTEQQAPDELNDAMNALDIQDDSDFTPSPREAFHTDPKLCEDMLRTIKSTVPLEIRASKISDGSGLFAAQAIEAGREIYQSTPLMAAINPQQQNLCHNCLGYARDGNESPPQLSDSSDDVTVCGGCKVARFCSKECQKSAWSKFHKDECKILSAATGMMPQNLLAHRLIFWQQRKWITTAQGRAILSLETHFDEYSKSQNRGGELTDIAMAVRKATGEKASLGLVWKIVPALRTNCVRIRMPAATFTVGYALDLVTATINHSCDPNAHVFFEGNQLFVRSIKKIEPGEEITISYIEPTFEVAKRQDILKHEYFFECSCHRCKSELAEELSLSGGTTQQAKLHQAQKDMLHLVVVAGRTINWTIRPPGFENLTAVETKLLTIARRIFPAFTQWPDHMEPLPTIRRSLATLYLKENKPAPALRNILKSTLLSFDGKQKTGPEWTVHLIEVFSLMITLLKALTQDNLPNNNIFADEEGFVTFHEMVVVMCGYMHVACREAAKAFGTGAQFTKDKCGILVEMVKKKKVGGKPGTVEFKDEFEKAQGKLLAWAGVGREGVVLD